MSKKNGIIRLVVMVLAIAFLAYTAMVGLGSDHSGSMKDIKQGLDLAGGVSITYEIVDEDPSDAAISDTIYKLQKRVEHYSTEAVAYKAGDKRITVDIPGVNNANEILEELGQPGTLSFTDEEGNVVLTGNNIKNAQGYSEKNPTTGVMGYGVSLTFDSEGQKIFSDFTKNHIGERLVISYDGEVVSAPYIQSHITTDSCVINNITDMDEANNLASTIRIGALPTELKEMYSSVVGAKLGSQAISTSLLAGGIGLALVMALMIVLYRIPGLASSLALLVYTGLVIMMLSAFQVTLTLPGIAGIILSIGMAVDANVIIFCRIKEEIGAGNSVAEAIKAGFSKALSAIIDGNITTLIAAGVLYLLGSGTVKGFAQTLAIGIVLSMFTALAVTRYALKGFYALGFQDEKFYGATKEVKTFDFVGKKKISFLISGVLLLVSVGAIGVHAFSGNAFNYSLEFVGGTSTNVVMDADYTIEELNKTVMVTTQKAIGDSQVEINKVSGTNEITIKTKTLTLEQRDDLYAALEKEYDIDTETITAQNISATVGAEMKRDAIVAVAVSNVLMLLYIWIRFKDIRFAGSAIGALCHDVLITVGAYALLRWSVGNTFIACMLTIIGYSINATIVVFDRIRELMKEEEEVDLALVVNCAVSQTFTRSIYTSLTTFIMVFMLFLLGVSSVREFAMPLMVGIVCGGFSSVCIAGALWYVLRMKFEKKEEEEYDLP